MTRETIINGRAGRIHAGDGRLRYECDGEVVEADFSIAGMGASGGECYSVLIGGRVIRVTPAAPGSFVAAGRTLAVEVFDPRDLRAKPDGPSSHASQQVRAPMPGKVVRVLVSAGESVKEGQGLVVVEAMKMQNEMKSPVTGRVAEVRAQAGATVKAGEVLVVIE
jgi:biotin carboxyl carrier protein